jgi:hypothetical protein
MSTSRLPGAVVVGLALLCTASYADQIQPCSSLPKLGTVTYFRCPFFFGRVAHPFGVGHPADPRRFAHGVGGASGGVSGSSSGERNMRTP